MKRISLVAAFVVALLFGFSMLAFAQSAIVGIVTKDANLRAGPGTTYAVVGAVKAGQAVKIVGKNPAGDWYHLDSDKWIASFLVKVTTSAPIPQATKASPKQTPSPTQKPPTATPSPTSAPTATAWYPVEDTDPKAIVFPGHIIFSNHGYPIAVLMVTNNTAKVKGFTIMVTYKSGGAIISTARGIANDLLPGETRAIGLSSVEGFPSNYDSISADVDTLLSNEYDTAQAKIARKIDFHNPTVGGSAMFPKLYTEATNTDSDYHSFLVSAYLTKGDKVIGYAQGIVNDIAPGQTKTVSMSLYGDIGDVEGVIVHQTVSTVLN